MVIVPSAVCEVNESTDIYNIDNIDMFTEDIGKNLRALSCYRVATGNLK